MFSTRWWNNITFCVRQGLTSVLFRRCYETVWLILHFPFLVIISPPLRNSGPCNSLYCLGHLFKNVYDDDDDDVTCAAVVTSDGDVSSHVSVSARQSTRATQADYAGGRACVTVNAVTTRNDSSATPRTQLALTSTTAAQTKQRFKRKPRILFSQAQVLYTSVIIILSFLWS